MKKALSFLLILSMILSLCLTACGGDGSGDNPPSDIMGGETTPPEGTNPIDPPQDNENNENTEEPLPSIEAPTAPEKFSEGLMFELNSDSKSYTLVGIGGCEDTVINIPRFHMSKPVTKISEEAFENNRNITAVYMPVSITEIGKNAFFSCTKLETVLLSTNLKFIPSGAFWGSGLKSIVIPDSVEYMLNNAFHYCASLESIKIGRGVTRLGASYDLNGELEFDISATDFMDCSSLVNIVVDEDHSHLTTINGSLYTKDRTTIVKYALGRKNTIFNIPDSVNIIGNYAFHTANNLEEIIIPDRVDNMLVASIRACKNLRKVTIPANVMEIGLFNFESCASLVEINVAEDNIAYKSVDGHLYTKDGKILVSYALGSPAESFVIPEGVETIGIYSFSHAPHLKEVVISEGVTLINYNAFEHCEALVKATLPSTLERIGMSAFAYCTSFDTFFYNGTEEMWSAVKKGYGWASQINYGLQFAK